MQSCPKNTLTSGEVAAKDFPPLLNPSQESQEKQTCNVDSKISHSVVGSESDSGKDDGSALNANQILDNLDDDEVQKLAEKVNGANLNNDDAQPSN